MNAHTPPYTKQQPTGAYRSTDAVNNPSHYTFGKVECIDAIESALSPEEFRGFLKGQVIKYVWRNGRKGDPREDAAKGEWYQRRLNQLLSGKPAATMREAKIAYDVACDAKEDGVVYAGLRFPDTKARDAFIRGMQEQVEAFRTHPELQPKAQVVERAPKWSLDWINTPPNCDGLSARDVRAPHPMASETLRAEDEFDRDDKASGV